MSGQNQENPLDPTRKSLLGRLKDLEDQTSWMDFFETYWSLIYGAARKAGLGDAEAQDVVQETVIDVTKKMPHFRYEKNAGSFKGWLLHLTGWKIGDQFRKRRKFQPIASHPGQQDDRTATIDRIPDPSTIEIQTDWDQEWEINLLRAATDRVKKKIDPSHYQIFDFYVVKEWPAAKVAKTLHINIGSVYLAKHRVSSLIRKEVEYLKENVF